jgi:hypothetical protein
MIDQADAAHPADGPQRITVGVDVLPGPLTNAIAERILQIVVNELLSIGAEVTAVRIEVRGWMAAW